MKRSQRLGIRVSPYDKKMWKEAARAEGKSLSAWIEAKLNETVQNES